MRQLDFTHSLPLHICTTQSIKIDWRHIICGSVSCHSIMYPYILVHIKGLISSHLSVGLRIGDITEQLVYKKTLIWWITLLIVCGKSHKFMISLKCFFYQQSVGLRLLLIYLKFCNFTSRHFVFILVKVKHYKTFTQIWRFLVCKFNYL